MIAEMRVIACGTSPTVVRTVGLTMLLPCFDQRLVPSQTLKSMSALFCHDTVVATDRTVASEPVGTHHVAVTSEKTASGRAPLGFPALVTTRYASSDDGRSARAPRVPTMLVVTWDAN